MPKIRWTDLPADLRQHLFDRVADRQISAEDLYKLELWRESEPEAPAGPLVQGLRVVQDPWRRRITQDIPLERTGGEGPVVVDAWNQDSLGV